MFEIFKKEKNPWEEMLVEATNKLKEMDPNDENFEEQFKLSERLLNDFAKWEETHKGKSLTADGKMAAFITVLIGSAP